MRIIIFICSILYSSIVYCQPHIITNIMNLDKNSSLLENIFENKVREINGNKITVFIKPIDSTEHSMFLIRWFNIFPYRYKMILENLKKAGREVQYFEVDSDSEMILKVNSTPNSIGYIDDLTFVHDVKNIKIFLHGRD